MRGFQNVLTMAVCGAAFSLTVSGSVQAATMYAGPTIDFFGADNQVYCQAVNTRATAVTVTIEAHNESGLPTASKTVTLAPGQGTSLSGQPQAVRCRFSAPSKTSISAMLLVYNPTSGNYTATLPAQ